MLVIIELILVMENALITGASKGMGRAIAIAFAKEGLNLAICSRNMKDLEQITTELKATNPNIKIFALPADASNKAELLHFAAEAELALGTITVLVNNLGAYEPNPILEDDDNTFNCLICTNLMPAYELYRYFGKTMIAAKKGHIFTICSIAALEPVVAAGTYTVTKAALLSLNNVMRLETQEHGIKVTAIVPGSTLTASWEGTTIDKNRFILPEDIASAIVTVYKMSPGANVEEIVMKPVFGQV